MGISNDRFIIDGAREKIIQIAACAEDDSPVVYGLSANGSLWVAKYFTVPDSSNLIQRWSLVIDHCAEMET